MTPDPTFDHAAAGAFLAQPHVGVLAVTAPQGPPAAVPLWYGYEGAGEDDGPGVDELWILTPPESRKARLLEIERHATLVVQTVSPRTRFVSVELRLTGSRPGTQEDARALATRYLAGAALEGYLQFAATQLEEHRYTFRTTRWRFADLTG
jgi:hypothetical protein